MIEDIEKKETLVKKYAEITGSDLKAILVIDKLLEQMFNKKMDEETKEKIKQIIADSYNKFFDIETLEGIINFWEGSIGKKVIEIMPLAERYIQEQTYGLFKKQYLGDIIK